MTLNIHQEANQRMVGFQRQKQAVRPAAQASGLEGSLPKHQCYYLKVTLEAHLENGTSFSQDNLKHSIRTLGTCTEHSEQLWRELKSGGGRWIHSQPGLLTYDLVLHSEAEGDEILSRATGPEAEENLQPPSL